MSRRVFPLLFLLAGSAALRAQVVPPTTHASQLSDDSIYALHVDPAAYHGQDVVVLLEDGVVRLEADGRYVRTVRQVVQVLTPDGAQQMGEQSFWYTSGRQRPKINWMRVVSLDGKVLREGPEHQQETSPPVEEGTPVYSDRRTIQTTLGGVAPGTIVDLSYTLETFHPWFAGDVLTSWRINGPVPIRRSRYVLDVPAGMDLRVRERNVVGAPRDVQAGGRRIRTWSFADVPAVEPELYAGAPNKVIIRIIAYAGEVSWHDVGTWYRPLLADRYRVSRDLLTAVAAQVKGAASLEDSLRAVYRWVAQDFRYVSLDLGDGGYRPRLPEEVYHTRFGDCKDKTTLFVSVARHWGLRAYPVLVSSRGGVDTLMPSLKPFDHMIAAVEREGRTDYLDLTDPLAPYGQLAAELEGEPGLALPDDGARVVVIPTSPVAQNRHDVDIVGALQVDRRFVGRITVTASGTEEYRLRGQLAGLDERDAKARDQVLRDYATSVYASATVDSAHYTDGRDLTTDPSVTVWFTATNVVGHVGTRYYFNLTLDTFADQDAVSKLDRAGPRRFPIDVAEVNSPSIYRVALQLELPEGWKAELPESVSVKGPFGYYRAAFRQEGHVLRISREMGGGRGVEPPDSVPALRTWLKGVAADRTEMIVLDRGTGPLLQPKAVANTPAGELTDVLLTAADLPQGAKLVREGPPQSTAAFLLGPAAVEPVESFERSFGAEQMVFTVGSTRLIALDLVVAAYRSRAEASHMIGLLDLVNLQEILNTTLARALPPQTTMEVTRSMALPDIGDHASGWVIELTTPVATIEMTMALVSRGRTSIVLTAVGPQGLQDADLAGLLATMDRRVRDREPYLADLAAEPIEPDTAAADSALRATTSVPLDRIATPLPDSLNAATTVATFLRVNGWPWYQLTMEGRGLTFPFGGADAIEVTMDVTLHGTKAQALKRVLTAERGERRSVLVDAAAEFSEMADQLARDDSTSIVTLPPPGLGERSAALAVRFRHGLKMDVDAVYFARGRLSGLVTVTWPPGTSKPAAAIALARDMLVRMRQVVPGAGDAPAPPPLVERVRRVVAAEAEVDSLVAAHNFDAVFDAIARAGLARAPVGFTASTWNTVCWDESLNGHAGQAKAACEAAVAPDTTVLAFRDSRGLERALTGDTSGAIADFSYVVAESQQGAFLDQRAKWLEALRAGSNPFTEDVLKQLRGP